MDDTLMKVIQMNQETWEAGYREGLKDGIRRYAIWKDGTQVVGVMQKPLKDVLAGIDTENIPCSK